ncbi:MAG: hypothetical protein COW67_05795 [Flavobacteriales bacterium CG18_big_fil_WC_8_21_14_2_50_32_9]|nr:MAG: hypothetical protein COW67_05795 [Flavobacteriales bacterium CG18_big_fil_WC_8_21_14_2_50_32_9]
MKKFKLISSAIITILFLSCSQAYEKGDMEESAQMESESDDNKFISSSAAVENNKDSTRKFIRTAELKFKVKNVLASTYSIENITNRQEGFVTYTNLISNINNVTTTAISVDSSLETTYFTVKNDIILRVPNTKLDTTLKEISKNIDFLDYRIIKAEDVALQILSNSLTQQRSEKNENRLINAIDNRGKKLGETTIAEEVLLSKQEQADRAKISNLSLANQINFSTINLSIYQRQSIKRELISNSKNIEAFEPSFGSKVVESSKLGWKVLEALILFLIKIWGLFLFAIIVFFIYKMYKHKLKK